RRSSDLETRTRSTVVVETVGGRHHMTSSETEARVPDTFTVAGNGITLVGDVWEPDGGDPVDEILMLHGGAQTRFSWNRAARRLSRERYRDTTMDARGHGDSA